LETGYGERPATFAPPDDEIGPIPRRQIRRDRPIPRWRSSRRARRTFVMSAETTSAVDFVRTGPATIGGRYLRRFWQPIYLSRDLAKEQAVPIRFMNENFTLYRGESGRAYVTAPRCPHRGTQLSTGRVQGEQISCRYHGWTFDPTGQCTAQPAEPQPFCSKV